MEKTNMMNAFETKQISLRKISIKYDDVAYATLLKKSKEPIEGQVYDPTALNVKAIEEYMIQKIGKDAVDAIDWEELTNEAPSISKELPAELTQGSRIQLAKPGYSKMYTAETRYSVVFLTPSHIVLLADGFTEPRVIQNSRLVEMGVTLLQVEEKAEDKKQRKTK